MTKYIAVLCTAALLLGTAVMNAQGGEGKKGDKKKAETKVRTKTQTKAQSKAAPVSYKKDVVPILKTYCLPCHSEDEMNPSELYMETYDQLMEGGKHGKPVRAGKADSSLLIQKISLKPPFGDPMPLKRKKPFPEDTLKILKEWINQGAKKE